MSRDAVMQSTTEAFAFLEDGAFDPLCTDRLAHSTTAE
jgi:hypothetical protein